MYIYIYIYINMYFKNVQLYVSLGTITMEHILVSIYFQYLNMHCCKMVLGGNYYEMNRLYPSRVLHKLNV